jgi:hypothetical protein
VAAGQVVLLGAGAAEAVTDLADLGSAGAGVDLDSLLAAVAGAWAMGLTAEAIRDGVASVKLNCG